MHGATPYQAGEQAGFDDAKAAELVKRGVAIYADVVQPEPKQEEKPKKKSKKAKGPNPFAEKV
jgi:hypothetical protein